MKSFYFRGHYKPCGIAAPHAPHVLGHYHTVAHGLLEDFCPGVSGSGLRIEGRLDRGSPEYPSIFVGSIRESQE